MALGDVLQGIGDFAGAFATRGTIADIRQSRENKESADLEKELRRKIFDKVAKGGRFEPAQSQELRRLSILNPQAAQELAKVTGGFRQERLRARAQDAQTTERLIKGRDFQGAMEFLNDRIAAVTESDGDPSETVDIQQRLAQAVQTEDGALLGDVLNDLSSEVQFGIERGLLKGAVPVSEKERAETGKIRAEIDAIRAKQRGKTVSDKERAETEKLRAEAAKIRKETDGGVGLSKADAKILEEERKATVKENVKRISSLQQSKASRKLATQKAQEFLTAFETEGAESGVSRRVTGFFVPGVFSSQGQFDQELDAFSEIAAREKLKAVGEIRPTDADVEGMKRALFGVGRDEATNINLLKQFIAEQAGLDTELEDLRTAKKSGTLAEFAGAEAPDLPNLPSGTVDNGDGTFTLPTGERVRAKRGNP